MNLPNNTELILATCPQLLNALEILHMWQEPYVDILIDIWNESPPEININQKIFVGMTHYDPRKDKITKRYILPNSLATWIQDVSEKRGHPFSYAQSYNLVKGTTDYGQEANPYLKKKLFTITQ